ncbi:acyltransferase family protein [Dongia sp.]|uniref:acyltransferase family protein n=1 Tax=Dongia sp. TaxID=1977262 RepID=UPI003751B979
MSSVDQIQDKPFVSRGDNSETARGESLKDALKSTDLITPNGASYLDFVRVVATNLVLLGHSLVLFELTPPTPLGGIGVTLFFLLSGFLITMAGYRRWRRAEPQFLPFMIDRCARIFVPFVPILICVAVLNAMFDLRSADPLGVNTGPIAFIANLFLLNDYPVLQAASHVANIADFYPRAYNTAEPFWTIPIEFWTYVVFAVFFFTFLRKERFGVGKLALLAVALPIFLWNTFAGGAGDLSLIWILGSLAAWLWLGATTVRSRSMTTGLILVAFGGICLAGRILKAGFGIYEFQQGFLIALVLFGGFLIFNAVGRRARLFEKGFGFLASYSYSLYLVHNTVLILLRDSIPASLGSALAAMVAAHFVAFVFYLLFERHYHKVGRWLKNRLGAQ